MSRRKVIIDGQEVNFTVVQSDPTQLRATITPSGDMARKAWYDRNPTPIMTWWGGTVAAGTPWTVVATYTVPAGKKAMHSVSWLSIMKAIETSGQICQCKASIYEPLAAKYRPYHELRHMDTTTYERANKTTTITFLMVAGDEVKLYVENTDTVSHWMGVSILVTEFNE